MHVFFNLLSILCSVYMLIIFVRIILSWFGGGYGRVETVLCAITDPYLNWFRRFTFMRIGFVDLSPIAGLIVLSLFNRIFAMLALNGSLSLGLILAVLLQIVWSALSFILGLFVVILILRLIAYLTNQNTFSTFWRTIDAISQPIVFRINRIIFGRRIVHYLKGLIASIAALILCGILGGVAVHFLMKVLLGMPV